MKIVSWNVNSIKARKDHVLRFLKESAPDVLMVQELKGLDFPEGDFPGYKTHAVGQKAYNGVAIFTKQPATIIHEALPGDESDEQARYLEFDYEGLRLINIYAPNGNPAPGEKFDYKCAWNERLLTRLQELRANDIDFAIGGDFNIIPEDKDCYNPENWVDDALFRPESRAFYRAFINLGLTDALRVYNAAGGQYTFWDYQAGAWQKDHGIRIDHFLLSPRLADRLNTCTIDREPRGWDKPSDHTPIIIELAT
jgi:exodeoxyribonuclease-3